MKINLKNIFLFFLLQMFGYTASFAQALLQVRGTVSNENGPFSGVSVVVKGTQNGTITKANGSYIISNVPETGILIFSSVGYNSKEIPVNNLKQIDVVLVSEVTALDHVVVIGYGVQEKKTLTGAVSTVEEKDLRGAPVANAASLLQGRVTGVTVITNNAPGSEPLVQVRGVGSINNSNPLYIIDGVPTTGGLNNVNPNDIESITVLKDASASAIYGSRAANGVIIITTKQGKSGKPKLSFAARAGVQSTATQLDLLNTREYGDLLWLQFKNGGLKPGDVGWGDVQYGFGAEPVIPDYIIPAGKMQGEVDESTYSYPSPYNGITKANKTGTNWYDVIFNPASLQDYNISMSGGTGKGRYAFSGSYMDQKGVIAYTGFKRYTLRSNADVKINNWLEVGESLGAAYTDRVAGGDAVSGTVSGNEGAIGWAHVMIPIIPVYDIRGNFAGTKAPTSGNGRNPLSDLYNDKDDHNYQMRILGNAHIQVNFTKNLFFKSLFGVDYNSNRKLDRYLVTPEYSESIISPILSQTFGGGIQHNWSNTLNYNKTFRENHKISVLLGAEEVNNYSESILSSKSTFAFTNLDYMVLDAGEQAPVSSGTYDQWKTFSYFGRVNYNYMGKYLLEGVVRRDASSRFSKTNRWGTFPAFSAGWRLSGESFMDNIKWINNLKLRFGWGRNGNDNVGNYNSYSTYRANVNESYYNISGTSGTQSTAGFHKFKLGNPDARWESTETTNIGVDLMTFNKFEVVLDIYSRLTTDMLYPDLKPAVWGALQFPAVNVGEMKNTGIDLMLAYHNTIGKNFSYNVRGNFSHYKNEVVKLNANPNEKLLSGVFITTAGTPISSFYGYVVEGIFNTQAEVGAYPKFNPDINGNDSYSRPGVFKYKDVNGDGKITADDRTLIGSPHPDLTYGFNVNLQYKGWDLAMFLTGVMGNKVFNSVNRAVLFNSGIGNRLKRRLYESWSPERYANGDKITMPIALASDANMSLPNSFFVEDGSYARMKDIQLGYTLPSSLASKWKIDRLRFYIEVSNLFTITKYTGLDPEILNTSNLSMGSDSGVYPTYKTVIFGINMDL